MLRYESQLVSKSSSSLLKSNAVVANSFPCLEIVGSYRLPLYDKQTTAAAER